jgi:hypothetical protein
MITSFLCDSLPGKKVMLRPAAKTVQRARLVQVVDDISWRFSNAKEI